MQKHYFMYVGAVVEQYVGMHHNEKQKLDKNIL